MDQSLTLFMGEKMASATRKVNLWETARIILNIDWLAATILKFEKPHI